MPQFTKCQRSYQRVRRQNVPKVRDIYSIPDVLRKTHRARYARPEDAHINEQFILHGPGQYGDFPMIIFATEDDLANLNVSDHVVCDGNF